MTKLFKLVRLLLTFYGNFFLVSMIVNGACLWLLWEYGLGIFSAIFWVKILSLLLTFYFINENKRMEDYYYRNLGISKMLLWSVSLNFDFALFIFFTIQVYKLR
jgi:hypothetical protein